MPTRKDARRNRELLLRAAAEVLAERGVDAPVSAIAKRAGLTKMTLYRHFETKDALINQVMADHYERLAATARELARAKLSGFDALAAYMAHAVQQLGPDRAYFHVALLAGAESAAIRIAATDLHGAVTELVRAAQADGAVRGDLDAGDVHSTVLGLTHSFSPTLGTHSPWWPRHLELVLDAFGPTADVVAEPAMRLEEYGRIQSDRKRRRLASARSPGR